MNLNIKHHDIKATIDGGEVWLQQDIGAGEYHSIYLAPEQFLMIADKLRGIVRPSAEVEESRKLRVIAERFRDLVTDENFRRVLLDGHHYTDYLEQVDALDDLAWEYAYGLQPNTAEHAPEKAKGAVAGGVAKAQENQQGNLLSETNQ